MILIEGMEKDGVSVSVTLDGKLKISGGKEMVEKWKPILVDRKSELLDTSSWRWLVTFPDGREILSHNIPFATMAEVARIYPEAKHLEAA